jgi:hypothetical protein
MLLVTIARVKSAPSLAILSIFGVWARMLPYALIAW